MNKLLLFTYSLLFIFTNLIFSQSKQSSIAKIGNEEISTKEFQIRYELMPRLSKDYYNTDSLKQEFLYSLIAEKLWAMEAKSEGLDTVEYLNYFIKNIEKLLVRDELYKAEIDSKIKLTENEISAAERKSYLKLKVNIISSQDSVEIFNVYSLLKNGLSIDSILTLNEEKNIETSETEIKFGDLEEDEMEDSLYNLKPGQFTKPIKNNYAWFIFKLKDFESLQNGNGNVLPPKQIKDILKERKAEIIGTEYLEKLLEGIKVDVNDELFWILVNRLESALKKNKNQITDTSKVETFSLQEFDILQIVNEMNPDTLNMPFIPINGNNISLKEFLYDLTFDGFTVPRIEKNIIASRLNSVVKNYTRNTLISKEGYKRNFQNLPEIKEELRLWKENYLANILRNKHYKNIEVSNDEMQEEYNRIYNSSSPVTEVNIIEILVDNLDVIQLILNELKSGKDFKELAEKYSMRESTKKTGGELGFFPVTMYGEIGRQAAKMKIDEIYGPIKLPEGYSIFKLIDKKEAVVPNDKTFNEVKDALKENIFAQKFIDRFNDYTGKLADKFGVEINQKNLSAIKVSNVNMFTYKYIGFGGVITAVPFTNSWYEWYDEWKNSKKVNP